MSLVESTLNKMMRDIINNIVSISGYAIEAKQNAPRPTSAYSSVNIVSIKNLGWEEITLTDRTVDLDIDEHIEGSREIMFSLQFYKDNAIDNASKVRIGLLRSNIRDIFRTADLGIVSRSDVRDISEPLENGWEKRAQLDLILSATGTDDSIVTSIQSATINGIFNLGNIQLPVTIEV